MGLQRNLLRRTHRGIVGRVEYPSKDGGSLAWQYSNERDALFLLLFYATVLKITTQSQVVTYQDADDKTHQAFPDFMVETENEVITV